MLRKNLKKRGRRFCGCGECERKGEGFGCSVLFYYNAEKPSTRVLLTTVMRFWPETVGFASRSHSSRVNFITSNSAENS